LEIFSIISFKAFYRFSSPKPSPLLYAITIASAKATIEAYEPVDAVPAVFTPKKMSLLSESLK